ncbi:uncharacterized protein PRCAT00000199001 [Priceomyces carsonii]|uniref:uncharacterized protein n=1 Tax=Priceomyces carsonii TaxID=28549 RepID=UPI002EDA567D|nr:unnamed protein product [Priceomyces carsonii]
MAPAFSIEDQLQQFESQRYPSVEETTKNNRSIIYTRKKLFFDDLKHLIKVLGYLLIVIAYLKDNSSVLLILRFFNQYCLSNPFITAGLLTEERKRAMTRHLLILIFIINAICFAIHILRRGSYSGGRDTLHGGLSVQFIGELPSFFLLVVINVAILLAQLLYHNVMCVVDMPELLKSPDTSSYGYETDKIILQEDGYSGDVNLVTMDLLGDIKKVWNYGERLDYNQLSSNPFVDSSRSINHDATES